MRATWWMATVALMALAGCASGGGEGQERPRLATERYGIEVKPAPVELKLAAHEAGLSAAQADALRTLIADWRDADGGQITVKSPEHGPSPQGAYRTASDAKDFLVGQGVPETQVRIEGYEASGDDHAPVLVGFTRYIAKGPDCGNSWSNLAAVDNNHEYPEFGCAVTADIAAQIANPADLDHPHASDPQDSGRRVVVVEKYRSGQITSTPKDQQADGTLASVGH